MASLKNFPIPLLGFAAFSGTGKTTLITQLLPQLTELGLRIGMVKHSHHDIEMDNPNKDSYKLRKAGACQMVLASPHRTIVFSEQDEPTEPKLITQLNWLNTNELDLVLVEGFRHEAFTKIELHRPSLGKPILANEDAHIIAIASDTEIDKEALLERSISYLDLNDINEITNFIMQYSRE
ncbi:molybdopterin-guanine dinucleotide biosynthesis protein B [Moritella viscosa]|uniref:Molybdopterin biosynthesis MoeA protein n=1 Tax=Moritella viscosa TaxID=80854 RepID=A0A090IDF3_9GAMM|nr:molybdopterin-guanine dinucleotide biosynthesis protein B [Moritella viscosa]CED60315.1 molybdopterin-guanine dinucleotide biosynthesis protein [Moritella viscosa]SGY98234.1 Molybdopterin biosynthesis MoeA protein [Moritella viscosa]SGZ05087.1 Molybdopterin biosynthesis MoeA protein [Moritella viscosa]SGZ12059.1 Molybdopterin biosynthesis MoeA protein [Moritella viscosa]SGZ12226.1 Molybdopterin biosynthesis MoeA protein [Moritella viscosa]